MPDPAFQVVGLAAVLPVRDMAAALAYYRDKLGFSVQFAWEEPAKYACLRLGEAAVHLNAYAPPAAASSVCIFCSGVDALHADFAARGAVIKSPPTDYPYGMREFEVADIDGHRLFFGQGVAE
jgi:uncharacterized glyoxalase superfamily protein PhnB